MPQAVFHTSAQRGGQTRYRGWLWALLVIYALARAAQLIPDRIPMVAVVSLHVLPPLAFALVHGAIVYRRRGILTFVLLCLVIGNALENLSVVSGFPFGHYHFTGVMGPKIFAVPILLGLAYIGMGYISWIVARLILGDAAGPLTGSRILTRPLAAAFVMVAWDFSMDAVWSNLVRGWTWQEGGAYFGVPVSNFMGWYLTVYLIYQSFALYLRRRPAGPGLLPPGFWRTAVLFYGVSAVGNLFVVAPRGLRIVTDASAAEWRVSGILSASALVSIFVMGAFTLLAWVRLLDESS